MIEDKKTPYLRIDMEKIASKISAFKKHFSNNQIYYAVKANSNPEILRMMCYNGINFDAASIEEIEILIGLGVESSRISFGSTIKKRRDVQRAYNIGIRRFVTDTPIDFQNIIEVAPYSEVFIRLFIEDLGTSDWPLSNKFGADYEEFIEIVNMAKNTGVEVKGLSFHVGSQQTNYNSWKIALEKTQEYIHLANQLGISIKHINLGGGIPASYKNFQCDTNDYLTRITTIVQEVFEEYQSFVFSIEPGRGLVGDAGTIYTEVVLIKEIEGRRWIYLDIGKFGGLAECEGEAIKYNILTCDKKQGKQIETVIAGPTCDSADILYQVNPYLLPEDIRIGDVLTIESTGAYTVEYSSICFNGFRPLEIHIRNKEEITR